MHNINVEWSPPPSTQPPMLQPVPPRPATPLLGPRAGVHALVPVLQLVPRGGRAGQLPQLGRGEDVLQRGQQQLEVAAWGHTRITLENGRLGSHLTNERASWLIIVVIFA